ncbi:hypothetical protein GCM10010094_20750 [Streptomyces flaveus]|uniref:Uncharacterized protein n=1 Tax=Streptomyces flaveus TaxID=66370 RepID=A0A917QNH0_9ACTN|nr:hypothetical protein GCM10010094_20750 [Streptomyces flaveus]
MRGRVTASATRRRFWSPETASSVTAELGPAIQSALTAGRPICIDVRVSFDPIPPEGKAIMGGSPFGVIEKITLATG